MSLGGKKYEKGEREKIRKKGEETPPKISLLVDAKLIFLEEGGGE